ncbi:MAG: hypothetical protein LLG13_18045 [Bacteroidales bacterium]|nr:hypothetical protein [Bacteroidales bacterium]
MKTIKLLTLLALAFSTTITNAQTKCDVFHPVARGNLNEAKATISHILNNERITISDVATGTKIKYKEASVFDDRIELTFKKGGSRILFFSDIFGDKNIEFVACKEHRVFNAKSSADYYNDYIDNLAVINIYFSSDLEMNTFKVSSSTRELADALYFIQNQLNITRYDSLLTAFKPLVEHYLSLKVKPSLSEKQREYLIQAGVCNKQKDYEKAIALFNKAIESDQTSYPAAYFNIALISAQLQRYEAAIFNMKKYLLLEPDAPDARSSQDKIYEWKMMIQENSALTN